MYYADEVVDKQNKQDNTLATTSKEVVGAINELFNVAVQKSALSPVLQEIDLTGTNAERKAKLDKFEADWKSLTGASDMTGARFVGYYSGEVVTLETTKLLYQPLWYMTLMKVDIKDLL